jgi:two-component system cell cycle sensor histidine kinase/response regulator CckA
MMEKTTKTVDNLREQMDCLADRIADLERQLSEAKQELDSLRETEKNFQLLTETIDDVFWISSPGIKEIFYVSPAYEKIWGRSRESLYEEPRSYMYSIHPEDRPRVLEWTRDYEKEIDYRIIRPDGSIRWIRDRGFPLNDEHGNRIKVVGIASDITLLRGRIELLQQAEKLSALEHMVGFVAHEVRNPLQVLQAGIEHLHNQLREDKPSSEILQELRYGLDQLNKVTGYLVDYALPIRPRPSAISVSELVEEAAGRIRYDSDVITIHKELDSEVELHVDKERMAQALAHILRNATEAMPDGGEIHIKSKLTRNRAVLTVTDSGIGIEHQNLSRLTEPFYTTKQDGTGLGLSITKKIVRAHKGSMTISSKPGKGTTVRIMLPVE